MKVINQGVINSYKDAETNTISSRAIKYIDPEAMTAHGKGVAMYGMWACLIPICLYSVRYATIGELFIPFNILGIAIGCVLLLPHELLRVPFFSGENVFIYQLMTPPKMFLTTDASMGKWRYIAACFFPNFVLGVIPLIIWIFLSPGSYLAKTLFSLGFVGTVTGGYDYMCAIKTMFRVPPFTKICFNGAKVYYVEGAMK